MDNKFYDYCNENNYEKVKEICFSINLETKDLNKGFCWNCKNGNIKMVQFMWSLYKIDIHYNFDEAFCLSCENGHLDLAKWLYSFGKIHMTDESYAFYLACMGGHLNVAKWLYSLGNIDDQSDFDKGFYESCKHNKLEIAQWIHTFGTININSESHAFCVACMNGHLDLVKWLYSYGNINLYTNSYNAFNLCCEFGHVELAKWLYSLGQIDIHMYADYPFTISCKNNHVELAQWLTSLNIHYHLITADNEIVNWEILNIVDIIMKNINENNWDNIFDIIKIKQIDEKCYDICLNCLEHNCENMIKLNCNHCYCLKSLAMWFPKTSLNINCPSCDTIVIWSKCTVYT